MEFQFHNLVALDMLTIAEVTIKPTLAEMLVARRFLVYNVLKLIPNEEFWNRCFNKFDYFSIH